MIINCARAPTERAVTVSKGLSGERDLALARRQRALAGERDNLQNRVGLLQEWKEAEEDWAREEALRERRRRPRKLLARPDTNCSRSARNWASFVQSEISISTDTQSESRLSGKPQDQVRSSFQWETCALDAQCHGQSPRTTGRT